MIEKSEIKEYKGYRYITVGIPMGYVCGYVEIPEGHYLFGKDYDEPIMELEPFNKEILEGSAGKRGSLTMFAYSVFPEKKESPLAADMFFDVHGSITFSGKLILRGEAEPVFDWVMGFDTAHFDDTQETQTHEFCARECEAFIDQLVSIDERLKSSKSIEG